MSRLARLRHQTAFDLLVFRRNPAGVFFAAVLPVIFLVLFTSMFGNELMADGVRIATLYVPGILALAIVSATTVNLAITMTTRRERGMLKRVRGTPTPPSVFIASQALTGLTISVLMTLLIIVIGRVAYDVTFNLDSLPSLAITIVIGAMSFSALGLALTAACPSEDAAPAVTNAIMLPLYFISDVFIPGDDVPAAISTIASIFPIQHLSRSLQESFDPFLDGTPWPWQHWLVIALWGAAGVAIALKTFRWVPRR